MNYVGFSYGFHDASIGVIDDKGNILFAGHSERYSGIKHDKYLNYGLVNDSLKYINDDVELHYYEKPLLKFLRQIRSGEGIKLSSLFVRDNLINRYGNGVLHTHSHHLCHAAIGFQTSNFNDATVVIIDAIGEFDTISIYDARYDDNGKAVYKKLYSKKYPNSIGLFYSAITQKVGLKPLDEEYILMGMSAYGKPIYVDELMELFNDFDNFEFNENLHIGLPENVLNNCNEMDLASSAQYLTERMIENVMLEACIYGRSQNLVYGGGVALNCVANRLLGKYYENIHIFPNPGDSGSSLGSAALGYGRKVNFHNCFLGYDIVGDYPIDDIINQLLTEQIVGVASGRAEFGPRALGNRSLLSDPRGTKIKDKVNEIKRRQKFRPFAPVILEEFVDNYFIMPDNWKNSRYMQVVGTCKRSDLFPAIVHVDNTSRIQTVPKDNSGIRRLLEKWYDITGCPMLLNTSLNIRGEPMVNNREDADRFEKLYGVKVFS